jgi:predicted SAM-dependent methyltransferase
VRHDRVVRLDIGSGQYRYKDFTTVDLYTEEADIKADMGNLPMIESGSVEEIWASHCLEHILPEKVQPTLKEWIRILRPGGIATIIVPCPPCSFRRFEALIVI